MHDVLKERILRHLDSLPEERLYQVADYIEFLSSKYAREAVRPGSPLQRFGERLEEKMRVHRVGMDAIRGTLGLVGGANRLVGDLREVGRALWEEMAQETPPASSEKAGAEEPRAEGPAIPLPPPRPARDDLPVDG